jgi:excisionase family DNA binding protein
MGKSPRRVDVQLLTIPEAAAALGITEKAIRRRIEQGSLASIRRGNRRMIPQVEVDRVRDELDFPSDSDSVGKGQDSAGNTGNTTTALVEQLGRAIETVRDETEKRVNAERDRDAAIERELSERQAREAAEGEIVELRSRIVELEAIAEEPLPASVETAEQSEAGEDRPAAVESSTEPQRRAWWQRMLGS